MSTVPTQPNMTVGDVISPIVTPVPLVLVGTTNCICSNPDIASMSPSPMGIASFTLFGTNWNSRHDRPHSARTNMSVLDKRHTVEANVPFLPGVYSGLASAASESASEVSEKCVCCVGSPSKKWSEPARGITE